MTRAVKTDSAGMTKPRSRVPSHSFIHGQPPRRIDTSASTTRAEQQRDGPQPQGDQQEQDQPLAEQNSNGDQHRQQ